MEIVIDIDAEEPLFAQLMAEIKRAVSAGGINPGDALPSIRQLANDLNLNNKTVAKAYQLLERDKVIVTKGYRGTFVHPDARRNMDFDLNAWVAGQINQTINACREKGATDSEIRIAFANIMQNKPTAGE
ncbi:MULTISPECIES: GntR family transcriptional regulator [Kordiimonas]|jgi:GntR family transcriptional regulator|uniref:GntR family transcriptional regulator n=1 Tax=Kordiimonas TaxID=288021 RepID=UPI0025799B15|nr:GntR family transcriptional regulator [Kordiimonas sp. UBA4487]